MVVCHIISGSFLNLQKALNSLTFISVYELITYIITYIKETLNCPLYHHF